MEKISLNGQVLEIEDTEARKKIEDCIKNTDSASDSDIAGLAESSKFIAPSHLKKAVETIGGVLNELTTTDKGSYVTAINELNSDLTQLDTRLSESITEINNGFVRITEIAKNLAVGGLTNGIYNPSLQYRVSSSIPEDALPKDTTVIIEDGRRLGVQIVGDDGTFISDSGFKTGYYVIPKEKKFMLCISATSSSSTEERQIKADVRTFESYLKVKSNIEEKFEKNDFEHSEINSILMPVSDKVFRLMGAEVDIPLTWKQGTITSSGAEGSNTQGNRIKTEFIDFSDYGIAEIKKNSGFEIKIFQYDSEGNYIKSPFDFVDSPTSESTSITIDEVNGKLYRFLLRVSIANEIIRPETVGGGVLAVGKINGEVDWMKREIGNIKDELSIVSAKPLSESFIELIAHRGGSNDGFYHNTLENVLACKKSGYSIIEFDVRETSDGVMVCVHDEVLTTYDESETITIANVTYDYLKSKQFFADPSIRIPTVIEIIDKCKQYGLRMLIDIKIISDINIEYLHNHLKMLHMDDKAMFASFSQGVLSRMRTHFANAPVFLNFSAEPTGDILESTTYKPIRDMIDAGKTVLAFSKYLNFTDEYYNRLRKYGFYVQIWTVANGDYKRFLGVADYLTTEEVRPWQLFE